MPVLAGVAAVEPNMLPLCELVPNVELEVCVAPRVMAPKRPPPCDEAVPNKELLC